MNNVTRSGKIRYTRNRSTESIVRPLLLPKKEIEMQLVPSIVFFLNAQDLLYLRLITCNKGTFSKSFLSQEFESQNGPSLGNFLA